MSRARKEAAGVKAPDDMGLEGATGHYTSAMFGLGAKGYELKGDGKKRRFKPFEAVRKFFGKNKRKSKDEQVSVVAVKAKSTTALHNNDDDDDDGGFKSHQPRPLGGNRSISEDSIFSPEQRETNLQALKKVAVSEESIPKSAFQAELFSKLGKRRSQYSDDDDGLPHSPTPPVTTADIIMGVPLKPGGKSTSRESDKSLISMDSSENEEDDPFQSKWKSSVPAKVSRSDKSPGSEGPIDFEKMSSTELLKSDAAKDRISIKPRTRKASRKSQKKRDGSSPHSLPSLNEESPTKVQTEEPPPSPKKAVTPQDSVELEVSIPPDKQEQHQVMLIDKVDAEPSQHQKAVKQDSTGTSQKARAPVPTTAAKPSATPESASKDEEKRSSLKSTTVTVSSEGGGVKAKRASFEGSDVKVIATPVPTASESKTLTVSSSVALPSETAKKKTPEEASAVQASVKPTRQSSVESTPTSKPTPASSSVAAAVEPSPTVKPQTADSSSSMKTSSSSGAEVSTGGDSGASACITITPSTSPTVEASKTVSSASISASMASKTSVGAKEQNVIEVKREGLRQTDGQTAAYSPKDDYKLRRQSRSKTLPEQPVSKDEQFAAKVQRTASHRVEPTSSQNASPEVSPRLKMRGISKSQEGVEKKATEPAAKSEPEWFALARRKTGRQEETSEPTTPTKEAASAKESLSISVTELADTSSKPDSAAAVKSEPAISVSKSSDTVSTLNVSSAASKFEKVVEPKPTEVTCSPVRGGSVKTSPTKVNTSSVSAKRGSSVKILSARSDVVSSQPKDTPAATPPATGTTTTAPQTSTTPAVSTVKQEVKKEESTSSESSFAKEVPKWKTQSTKTAPTFSTTPAATPVSTSRFGSVKSQPASTSTTTPAPTSSTAAKVESKTSSPVKNAPLNKTPSVDAPGKEDKEKTSVPAWRANLGQKKPVGGLGADIKIELIESNPSASASTSSTASNQKKEEAKKPESESPSKTAAGNKELQTDQCRGPATSRKSKVLDLVKNFQNLQVS